MYLEHPLFGAMRNARGRSLPEASKKFPEEANTFGDWLRGNMYIGAEEEFGISESNRSKAIRLNRCTREWLGWINIRRDIYRLPPRP